MLGDYSLFWKMCGSGDYTEHCFQWRPEKKQTCPINHRSGRRKTFCENFGNFAEHFIPRAQKRAVQHNNEKPSDPLFQCELLLSLSRHYLRNTPTNLNTVLTN